MRCNHCRSTITPGLELTADPFQDDASVHCPYCLHILASRRPGATPSAAAEQQEDDDGDISVQRTTLRRQARDQLADRLTQVAADGKPHCPVCARALNRSDELLLRSSDHFRCHHCGHDLATIAYRHHAYAEQRWLQVVHALGDLRHQQQCRDCTYLGAMAKACQRAFSWIPTASSDHNHLLADLLSRSEWSKPDCDWESSCLAARQYRTIAADGLRLL
jgi:ribosomal protein L37AE/L43A